MCVCWVEKTTAPALPLVLRAVPYVDLIVTCWHIPWELRGQIQIPVPPVSSSVALDGLLCLS